MRCQDRQQGEKTKLLLTWYCKLLYSFSPSTDWGPFGAAPAEYLRPLCKVKPAFCPHTQSFFTFSSWFCLILSPNLFPYILKVVSVHLNVSITSTQQIQKPSRLLEAARLTQPQTSHFSGKKKQISNRKTIINKLLTQTGRHVCILLSFRFICTSRVWIYYTFWVCTYFHQLFRHNYCNRIPSQMYTRSTNTGVYYSTYRFGEAYCSAFYPLVVSLDIIRINLTASAFN